MTTLKMARAARALALMLAGFGALQAATLATPAGQAVERHAFAAVLDSDNVPVTGLTASDFVVREDGIAREVLDVSTAAPPSHVVLLVDNSEATSALTLDLRNGLKQFVEQLADDGPLPPVRLATFGDRPTTQVEFTTSAPLLIEGVERLFPQPGSGATLLEALQETAADLRTRGAERPVIVAFVAEAGPEFSNDLHTRVAAGLREAGAALWAVSLQDRQGPDLSDPGRERAIVLGDVTRQSGGLSIPVLSRPGITHALETVAAALTSQYDVTYARPETLIPPSRVTIETRTSSHQVIAPAWPGR